MVVHQEGLAAFEEAYATWSPTGIGLAFGKQTLPLGSYPNRLIHDPLLQADLETIAPSLLATKEFGPAKLHLGLASHLVEPDSTAPIQTTGAVGALDWEGPASASLRLSGQILRELRLVDLGLQWRRGPVLVDLEGFLAQGAWARAAWAALAGLGWNATESLALATRFDARKATEGSAWEGSVACGASHTFARYAYLGAEWLQPLGGDGILTLRVGWEAPLSIP